MARELRAVEALPDARAQAVLPGLDAGAGAAHEDDA
jgi:hypothetical protein